MDESKIQLSEEEMKLVSNSEWILTKHRVIEKVYRLFGNLSMQMQSFLEAHENVLPPGVLQIPPKISKGEQYEAMPYVVLDYPRLFSKEDVFAIRSFFWWGNYFSITLHLKGKFYEQWYKKIARAVTEKQLEGFYYSCAGNEFSFDLSGKNYFSCDRINIFYDGKTGPQPFLKISYKISFEQWDTAEQRLMEAFKRFMRLQEID
ncbi:MAG: hypothetical protein ABJB86_14835 [Bacteroidota bacterium]